jgi:Mrp family chromosome partitioning ATPase
MIVKDSLPPISNGNPSFQRDDIDLSKVWRTFKSNARWILSGSVLIGVATTVFFLQQPRIYAATLRLVAANNPTMNQSLNQTLVTAPGLPRGTLEGALAGSTVLRKVQAAVETIPELNAGEKKKLQDEMNRAMGMQRSTLFTLSSQIDAGFNGIYILKAEHTNPIVAAKLANLAGDALLDWDTQRALRTVNSSQTALENQIKDIDAQISRTGVLGSKPTVEQRTLLELRVSRVGELNNIRLFSRAVIGTLTVVAPAEPPLKPIRPEPYRNGALATALGLFLLTAIALFRAQWVRAKVENGNDVKRLGLYEIATLPRVQSKNNEKTTTLQNIMTGAAGQSLQFIRAYLLLLLGKEAPKTILVTSSLASEGKSLISAALAKALASDGNRVLLIDADLSKPEQIRTWGINTDNPTQGPIPSGESVRQITICDGKTVRNPVHLKDSEIATAIQNPDQAHALAITENLHLIPAIKNHDEVHSALNIVQLELAIQRWSSRYDVFVIDSPPLLVVADSVMISSIVSGVIVVTEANRTPIDALERSMDMLNVNRARIFGVVLNKANIEDENQLISYGYGKGYGYGNGEGYGFDESKLSSKKQKRVLIKRNK